jgi:hypothetical protein
MRKPVRKGGIMCMKPFSNALLRRPFTKLAWSSMPVAIHSDTPLLLICFRMDMIFAQSRSFLGTKM